MKSDPGAVSLSHVLRHSAETRSLKNGKFLALGLFLMIAIFAQSVQAMNDKTTFKRISTQFIAALGDPNASSGNGAQSWGLWSKDPGPRGVRLKNYDQLQAAGGVAPAQWKFDQGDWWLEENG